MRGDHFVQDERAGRFDALDRLDVLLGLAVVAKIDPVLDRQDVAVDPQDPLAERVLKPAGDSHDTGQRHHPQKHAQNGDDGDRRQKTLATALQVAQGYEKFV